ncbi:hypothetical protein [Ideonella sp. A 288]|uniref:hypothetical protein n=1 Tax=Ideonella sp. A 288 TaxID=1962181 RepID=UPI0011858FE6|nr:hypothetical protein [Ideonella sp. A 288]
MSTRLKILGIKYRHFIPLASFDTAVAKAHRFGSGANARITRHAGQGLAICDLGNLEIVGCHDDLPDHLRGASMVLEVRGLLELAADLTAQGGCILHGPEPTGQGLSLRVRHRSGEVVDYLEPVA